MRLFDLGQQESSTPQFRIVQSVHETFARSLSNSLSTFLQSEVEASLADIRLTTAGDFQTSLLNPSCWITLQLHPEVDSMLLCVDSATVLTLLDLLLGGTGIPPSTARELTEIEWSLLEEISRVILRSLGESWQNIKAVEFVVESMGSDPSLMPCADPGKSMLRISFDLQLPKQTGKFQIAVAPSFFDAAAPALPALALVENAPPTIDIHRNMSLLEDAEVELEVQLEGSRLSFGELISLQQGQVVRFDHALHEPLRGLVNGDLFLMGRILSAGRKRAFQLDEACSQ